jgi:hypothetical protein
MTRGLCRPEIATNRDGGQVGALHWISQRFVGFGITLRPASAFTILTPSLSAHNSGVRCCYRRIWLATVRRISMYFPYAVRRGLYIPRPDDPLLADLRAKPGGIRRPRARKRTLNRRDASLRPITLTGSACRTASA